MYAIVMKMFTLKKNKIKSEKILLGKSMDECSEYHFGRFHESLCIKTIFITSCIFFWNLISLNVNGKFFVQILISVDLIFLLLRLFSLWSYHFLINIYNVKRVVYNVYYLIYNCWQSLIFLDFLIHQSTMYIVL